MFLSPVHMGRLLLNRGPESFLLSSPPQAGAGGQGPWSGGNQPTITDSPSHALNLWLPALPALPSTLLRAEGPSWVREEKARSGSRLLTCRAAPYTAPHPPTPPRTEFAPFKVTS